MISTKLALLRGILYECSDAAFHAAPMALVSVVVCNLNESMRYSRVSFPVEQTLVADFMNESHSKSKLFHTDPMHSMLTSCK